MRTDVQKTNLSILSILQEDDIYMSQFFSPQQHTYTIDTMYKIGN